MRTGLKDLTFKIQPHKMVKHTKTIRWQQSEFFLKKGVVSPKQKNSIQKMTGATHELVSQLTFTCSKLTIETLEGVNDVVKFEHISHLFLVFFC